MSIQSISNTQIEHKHTCFQKTKNLISRVFHKVFEEGVTWHTPLAIMGFSVVWIKYSLFYATAYIAVAAMVYNISLLYLTEETKDVGSHKFSSFLKALYKTRRIDSKTYYFLQSKLENVDNDRCVFLNKIRKLHHNYQISDCLKKQLELLVKTYYHRSSPFNESIDQVYKFSQDDKETFINKIEALEKLSNKKEVIHAFNECGGNSLLFELEIEEMYNQNLFSDKIKSKILASYKEVSHRNLESHDFVSWATKFQKESDGEKTRLLDKIQTQTKNAVKFGYILSSGTPVRVQSQIDQKALLDPNPHPLYEQNAAKVTFEICEPLDKVLEVNEKTKACYVFDWIDHRNHNLSLRSDYECHFEGDTNMILSEDKVFFIDFGLGEINHEIEAKGVDLHVLMETLESTHSKHADEFKTVLKGYQNKYHGDVNQVKKKIQDIIKRGRYR